MRKYSNQIFILWLMFLVTIIPSLPVAAMERTTIGLLKINNYSGIDSVGGNKLEELVVAELLPKVCLILSNQILNWLLLSPMKWDISKRNTNNPAPVLVQFLFTDST